MFGMWDVLDVGCLGRGMFAMWDVGDVRCWGCGMFGMWNVWDVGCLPGCGMLIYKMPNIPCRLTILTELVSVIVTAI